MFHKDDDNNSSSDDGSYHKRIYFHQSMNNAEKSLQQNKSCLVMLTETTYVKAVFKSYVVQELSTCGLFSPFLFLIPLIWLDILLYFIIFYYTYEGIYDPDSLRFSLNLFKLLLVPR